MTEPLKPCPFCPDGGSPMLTTWGNDGWGGEFDRTGRVSCKKCLTGGPIVAGRDDDEVALLAARVWNTRAESVSRIDSSDLPDTSPLMGIPFIRVYDKDGRKTAEGYYVFHERRQPAAYLDELKPEDCAHYVVFDESADWSMPKRMCRKLIVPDGGWVEVVSDAD